MTFRVSTIAILLLAVSVVFGSRSVEAGGGCHNDRFSDESGTQVELSKNCFEPTVVRVQPGDQITWNNSDPDEHTVTGASMSFGNYDPIAGGGSVSYVFEQSGVFPYFCVLHPSMVGAVVVGDGSAASVSDAGSGAKAVSAEVAGVESVAQGTAATEPDSGDATATWFVVGGALVAVATVGGLGLAVRRAVR